MTNGISSTHLSTPSNEHIFSFEQNSTVSAASKIAIMEMCLAKLLEYTQKALLTLSGHDQSWALQFISSFASSPALTEKELYTCFCMLIYFSMSGRSEVSRLTNLTAMEICQQHNILPSNLLAWYKTSMFKLIIPLCISNYLQYGIRLENSLIPVSVTHD